MSTILRPNSHSNAMQQSNYIAEFKDKNEYEQRINSAWRRAESECVETLLEHSEISSELTDKIQNLAFDLAHSLRERKGSGGKAGIVQGLLQEFSLSSQEGIALMCLAEALLRIPDTATRDLLIRDKINQGNWKEHLGQSQLMFVNAAAWGLMLTGKLMETPQQKSLSSLLTGLLARSGRGIIRKAVDVAMRMMGEQFVTGETIDEALKNAERLEEKGFQYSYDMLGEAALTYPDAERYYQDYQNAIHAIGQASTDKDVYNGPGISIKLSALHPRYQRSQMDRVNDELYSKVLNLAVLAKKYNIGLNIDAEETERLEISLELLERLCFEPTLNDWKGIGFVIQAYQKRCFYVVDYIIDLAKRSQKRLMIRLVKGAYWDSEIKKAQIEGMADYPVFTRKVHTDLSYIACARKLLAEPDYIYPQFATHNAQTVATIYQLANPERYYAGQYEFQCLHGMGEPLYENVVGDKAAGKLGIPCRIYAPVGNHETLLAYLVRRLLENGANTSFVNRIADKSLKVEDLIENPRQTIIKTAQQENVLGTKHPHIPYPQDLYGTRINSSGLDLANDAELNALNEVAASLADTQFQAAAMGTAFSEPDTSNTVHVINPAQHQDIVGTVYEATTEQAEIALIQAANAQHFWANLPKNERAACLNKAAELMQQRLLPLMVLLSREAGKTYANAIAEVREAIDFLRYYAGQMSDLSENVHIQPLGIVLCISPWNFPLAIFTGQISAALVAGNTVIAKPAEQTPLIAAQAVQILWEAGIPQDVLQLLPGRGETIGAQLSQDSRIQGIMFTGSTEVAKILQKTVAKRLNQFGESVTLIAETGGQNAMIVDSSALTEQVVLDVVNSAYDSAGQRCSALRVLCVQEDNLDTVRHMLKGAMQQLRVGNPVLLKTDIGPVIDAEAQQNIQKHIDQMRSKGHKVHQLMFNQDASELAQGTFIPPTLIELPNLNDLEREVFGPVLHLISYKAGQLPQLLDQINSKGYGLTMGLHTRIDETMQTVISKAHVGNLYINRNIVGAVVGVQPFGGEGLSGTGPKAGGPLYIYRLMHQVSEKKLAQPYAMNSAQATLENPLLQEFKAWVYKTFPTISLTTPAKITTGHSFSLQGPTGEENQYMILPRESVLSLATNDADQIQQLLAIISVGSRPAVLADNTFILKHLQSMSAKVVKAIKVIKDIESGDFEAVLHHGDASALIDLQQRIATRQGPIVGITHLSSGNYEIPVERFVIERAISINTAAAGGNASLMTMSGL
ncbi:trifunctional transcriptional regulator/proline dehydrogenase/L-glutamate gamma-semialdehyde dehydrogenase [Acinetobacter schindleri]|uniref:trifunctional transcriptional regulator/proline dehydrogenase/L-glutamate gamma-semialdehyde dehydrogenase n=1 Tax=Acinetobacter schindleri TaxID=108981 RepID=UPI0016115748|nr:trifunctional transcriptional regulator/proline dehydrogenase/L-glutamate gamma-semialdehyde dehydrogenase [Acinetobacter schindleri]MBB4835726.1 RHH-type proline utilization regulon transcriptional repressor/proline dehydrogenase/delta 1-pyrroline-5-carboxylate dehydrogenase [Acinetobacter schindleri]WBX36877.1 trifunctional transcriptional regulator/proline dehydrogenase/L-glutamate gamma-semialdehyde dehydrogenase [Acinetobacter schindleri]